MTHFFPADAVEGVPSGMCACRLNGENLHVAAVSPRSIWLRTPEELPGGTPELYFYRPETGGYVSCAPKNVFIGSVQRENGAVLTRFCFDDPVCAAEIRRMLNSYARYLEIRSTGGAAAYSAHISAYPEEADEVFSPSPEIQRARWYREFPGLRNMPSNRSLAVALHSHELWQLYLEVPAEDFLPAYAANRALPAGILPVRRPDRLYIGNPYCDQIFPEAFCLAAIAAKADREGLRLSIVTAGMHAGGEAAADAQIAFAADAGAELCVNDWGVLRRAKMHPHRPEILLGTLLNRRRKDPRMAYKPGLQDRKALLAQNALNDPGWLHFLQDAGVVRFEYESCGLPTVLPNAPCSLHLPYYQTNTSRWCPLRALCERGDRGAQKPGNACPGWCAHNELLYPDHLKMTGSWNSLLALDSTPGEALAQDFDRWVLNF